LNAHDGGLERYEIIHQLAGHLSESRGARSPTIWPLVRFAGWPLRKPRSKHRWYGRPSFGFAGGLTRR
jgi:hypothetical protein